MTKRRQSKNLALSRRTHLLAIKKDHRLIIPAATEHLAEVRDFVADFAVSVGFSDSAVEEVRLAVDEACTNVIKHAYQYDSDKKLEIKVGKNKSEMWVAISDEGIAFDPSKYTEPDLARRIKEKKRGGFGIYLIKKFMDKVEYKNQGTVNELKMSKKI